MFLKNLYANSIIKEIICYFAYKTFTFLLMSKDCFDCKHREVCLSGLKPEELSEVNKNKIQLVFNRNELICKRGSPITHVLFLLDGFVKWHVDGSESKKNVIFKLEKQGSFIGVPSVFGDKLHHFSTTAIEGSKVCMIDVALFMKIFRANNDFAESILNFICSSANGLFDNLYSYATKNVNGRVAELLLYLAKDIYSADAFTLTLSRQELSEIVNISKDNLIHTLSKYNNDGIIKSHGKNIEILRYDLLKKICETG